MAYNLPLTSDRPHDPSLVDNQYIFSNHTIIQRTDGIRGINE